MIRYYLLLYCFLFSVIELHAQKKQKIEEKFGFFLEGNNKFVRIPFQMHSNLIIIPLKINNSDTLHFVLDTGVSSIIVTNPNAIDRRTLNFTRQVKITGAGEGQSLSASVAIGNTLRMGRMRANYQNMVVLDEDVLKLSEYVGIPIDGIFGYELFNNFVVTIDFTNQEILIIQPKYYKYRKFHGDKYPITIEDTKPYAEFIALVEDGRELPLRVVIDTGAGHALLIDKSEESQIQLPEKVITAQLGRGLNGVINGKLGRIEKVKFGKYQLQNVLASFPDSLSFGVKFDERHTRQGNVGCELLRRFKVTLNYGEKYMVLKPVKRRMKETFEHDMSGIELKAKGKELKEYVITAILPDSPAWNADLHENDEILYINDQLARDINISDIYKIFQKGEGKEISILIKRQGQIMFKKFQLKRMI